MDMQSLHSDILLHVFPAVALNEPPHFMRVAHLDHPGLRKAPGVPNETRDERLGFVRLGHVDRTWRVTLLSAQALWADHLGLLPAGFDEMFARAGSTAPLTLHLPLGSAYLSAIITHLADTLQQHGSTIRARLRGIAIWDPVPTQIRADPIPSQIRAPRLRTDDNRIRHELATLKRLLSVLWNDTSNDLFPFSIMKSALLAEELPTLELLDLSRYCSTTYMRLHIDAPNLRHLRLRNCPVLCPQSTRLVTISITRTREREFHISSPKMTIDEILALLKHCATSLRHLELDGVFSDQDLTPSVFIHHEGMADREQTSTISRSVHLPMLRTITLTETHTDIARLLTCLCYSQSTMIYLKSRRHRMPGPFASALHNDADTAIRAAVAKYPGCRAVGLYYRDDLGPPGSIDLYALPPRGR